MTKLGQVGSEILAPGELMMPALQEDRKTQVWPNNRSGLLSGSSAYQTSPNAGIGSAVVGYSRG